ncbi:hypothetical protein BH10PSE12_BH10PSE12_36480 [soil metagenome]
MDDVYVNERTASAKLSIPVSTLQKYRASGSGPRFSKIGKSVRYRLQDLDAFMSAHVVSA